MTTTEQADKALDELIANAESTANDDAFPSDWRNAAEEKLSLLQSIKSDREALKIAYDDHDTSLRSAQAIYAALTKQDETILKLRR